VHVTAAEQFSCEVAYCVW